MNEDQLEAIMQRHANATGGEWWDLDIGDGWRLLGIHSYDEDGNPDTEDATYICDSTDLHHDNAAFICAARQDIPDLVAEVRKLQLALYTQRHDKFVLRQQIMRLQLTLRKHGLEEELNDYFDAEEAVIAMMEPYDA